MSFEGDVECELSRIKQPKQILSRQLSVRNVEPLCKCQSPQRKSRFRVWRCFKSQLNDIDNARSLDNVLIVR